jgi:D-alanine-D-alanine ligase-like ATP-grasp enzyme
MKPLAVLRTGQPMARAAPLRRDPVGARSHARAAGGGEGGPASQAFGEYDAKDVNCGPHHNRPANLKPNIYYKAQDFTLGAHRVPGCRGASRADRHLYGTAGEESEPVGPAVEARLGRTETSCAPGSTAHAGFSFDEPGAWMVEDAACDC